MTLTVRRRLVEVCGLIADADLLLFRRPPGSLVSRAICTSGRSIYSHAAMAVRWRTPGVGLEKLLCVEVRELVGGRAVTLESQVAKFPGLIDVYRAAADRPGCVEFSRLGAVAMMLSFTGQPYGYRAILRAAQAYIPVARWFFRTSQDDSRVDGSNMFCSEAVSRATRLGGGVDPVPNLDDADTEPGDLARSDFYRYRFTLEP